MQPCVWEVQPRSHGPGKDVRQVHNPLFVNKHKPPILILFCHLSELYVELWEADREETIRVCLHPELFVASSLVPYLAFGGR